MCTFECKVTQGCEKPWSSPHAAALSKSPQVPVKPTCRTSESDAVFGLVPQRLKRSTPHERSSGPSSRCRPSYSAPATRANQPSRPREKEGEPCRVWEAIESIPGRLAPCRVENGGGRGNCSVKLGRVNMHVGSRSAAIGLDHARSPVPSKKSVLDKRHAPEKGGRREEGRHDGSRCEPSVPRTVR